MLSFADQDLPLKWYLEKFFSLGCCETGDQFDLRNTVTKDPINKFYGDITYEDCKIWGK